MGAAGLAIATGGTSLIPTGGGKYGDETVADSLFPKAINDAVLGDREKARRAKDAAEKDAAEKMTGTKPAPAPDTADLLNKQGRSAEMLRMQTQQGRRSTFLTGPAGDTSTLTTKKPTLLGGM